MASCRPSVCPHFSFRSKSRKPIVDFFHIAYTHTLSSGCRCAFWGLWPLTYFFTYMYLLPKIVLFILYFWYLTNCARYSKARPFTIKQNLRFQVEICPEKFQLDQIKKSLLAAIIDFNIWQTVPDSWTITLCVISGKQWQIARPLL